MGVEDCLVLSVYVPKKSLDEKKLLPVMVWIHGGGFTEGSGNKDFYGPERYMDYGIVGFQFIKFISFHVFLIIESQL